MLFLQGDSKKQISLAKIRLKGGDIELVENCRRRIKNMRSD